MQLIQVCGFSVAATLRASFQLGHVPLEAGHEKKLIHSYSKMFGSGRMQRNPKKKKSKKNSCVLQDNKTMEAIVHPGAGIELRWNQSTNVLASLTQHDFSKSQKYEDAPHLLTVLFARICHSVNYPVC